MAAVFIVALFVIGIIVSFVKVMYEEFGAFFVLGFVLVALLICLAFFMRFLYKKAKKEKEELKKKIEVEKEERSHRDKLINCDLFQYSLSKATRWYKVFNAVAENYKQCVVFWNVSHYCYDSRYPLLDSETPSDFDKFRGIENNYIYFDILCDSDLMLFHKEWYYSFKSRDICDAKKYAFNSFFQGHFDSIDSALHAIEYDNFDYFFDHMFENPTIHGDSRLIVGFWAGESLQDSKIFIEELYKRCANIPSSARWPDYVKRAYQPHNKGENKPVTPATVVHCENKHKPLCEVSASVLEPAKSTPNISIKRKIILKDGTFCTAAVSTGLRKILYSFGLYRQAVITDHINNKSCNLEEMAWFSKENCYSYDITYSKTHKKWLIKFKAFNPCYVMLNKGKEITSMFLDNAHITIVNNDTKKIEQDFSIMVT